MGLIKTANAVLKRIQTSLKENGHPYEFEFVQDMDNILSHCQKISPLVSTVHYGNTGQGRNRGKILAATSVMVGKICPPWLI